MQIQNSRERERPMVFCMRKLRSFYASSIYTVKTRDFGTASENQPRSADRCPHRNAGILGFRGPTPLSAVRPIVIVANYTVSVNCYTDVTPCKQPSSKLGRVEGSRGC